VLSPAQLEVFDLLSARDRYEMLVSEREKALRAAREAAAASDSSTPKN
jgi:hypothetical protein